MQIFFIIIIIVIIIKSEADDRIDSTVWVNHVIGDNVEQIKTTGKRDGTVRCTKINYHRATEIGYPENEKHYNDGCSHLKHVSVIVIVIVIVIIIIIIIIYLFLFFYFLHETLKTQLLVFKS